MGFKYLKLFLLAISLFLIFSHFKLEAENNRKKGLSKGIVEFYKTGIVYNPLVDEYVEEDYFSENTLQNGDFSNGLSHWATTGAEIFSKTLTKNKFLITDEEYVSASCSLKVIAKELPCRLYYSKDKEFRALRCPQGYTGSSIWLGVKPRATVKASLYYKGAGPTVYICLLKRNGMAENLDMKMIDEVSAAWKKLEVSGVIPQDGRAIALEITINKNQPGRVIFLDNIKLEVDFRVN